MAILDLVPGLSVSIQIEGTDLPEYEDDEESQEIIGDVAEYQANRTVSKYIESLSDKDFTVHLLLKAPYDMTSDSVTMSVDIDGKSMAAKALSTFSVDRRIINPTPLDISGVNVNYPGSADKMFFKNFRFAEIETTQQESHLKTVNIDAKHIDHISEISVKVHRGGVVKKLVSGSGGHEASFAQTTKVQVHEKALKGQAKSHSTSFGPATQLVPKAYGDVEWLDGKDYPIAIFRFRYRSKAALKSLLIIPRSVSPESVGEAPIDLQNLDPARRAQVEHFLRGLNAKNRSSSTPDRKVKRERNNEISSEGSKKRRNGKKVTIDLTEDSDKESVISLN